MTTSDAVLVLLVLRNRHFAVLPIPILYANPQLTAARIFKAWDHVRSLASGRLAELSLSQVSNIQYKEYPWKGASHSLGADVG
jgi:hypothetical protein